MSRFDFAAAALRIRRAWETGRICSLAGRAMRGRVLRAEAAWRAGLLSEEAAARIAAEAEGVAFSFAPIPVPGGRPGRT